MSARNRFKRERRNVHAVVDAVSRIDFPTQMARLYNQLDAEPTGTGADDMREDGYVWDHVVSAWRRRDEDVDTFRAAVRMSRGVK